jgi:hypothetical protein
VFRPGWRLLGAQRAALRECNRERGQRFAIVALGVAIIGGVFFSSETERGSRPIYPPSASRGRHFALLVVGGVLSWWLPARGPCLTIYVVAKL